MARRGRGRTDRGQSLDTRGTRRPPGKDRVHGISRSGQDSPEHQRQRVRRVGRTDAVIRADRGVDPQLI